MQLSNKLTFVSLHFLRICTLLRTQFNTTLHAWMLLIFPELHCSNFFPWLFFLIFIFHIHIYWVLSPPHGYMSLVCAISLKLDRIYSAAPSWPYLLFSILRLSQIPTKAGLSQNAKLSIYQSIFIPSNVLQMSRRKIRLSSRVGGAAIL